MGCSLVESGSCANAPKRADSCAPFSRFHSNGIRKNLQDWLFLEALALRKRAWRSADSNAPRRSINVAVQPAKEELTIAESVRKPSP
jgi:hypothetical protein